MPSTNRRWFLASVGAVSIGSFAGCAMFSEQSPPAGSLRFENDHHLPHLIRLEVTDVGSEPGTGADGVTGTVTVPASQRNVTTATTVRPDSSQTFESVFTESAWYSVQFTIDGELPGDNSGTTRFNPAADDGGSDEFLTGHVYESGEFSWEVRTSDDAGSFS